MSLNRAEYLQKKVLDIVRYNMDVLTNFLENSSIHGLAFISRTQAFRRAFWVCVVFTGFTAAAVIISESFRNWNETPIITTLETLSIEDIRFPKVTVCPPPNTYTNLNHDLMRAGNTTITDFLTGDDKSDTVKIEGIIRDLLENILNSEYEQAWAWYFEEDNKYGNWYSGYSMEENPLEAFRKVSALQRDLKQAEQEDEGDLQSLRNIQSIKNKLKEGSEQKLSTCAISGTISTPKFGKPFNRSVFINPLDTIHVYSIIIDLNGIISPNDEDVTLNLNIEIDLQINEWVELCGKELEESVNLVLEITNCSPNNQTCKRVKRNEKHCGNKNQIELNLFREEFDKEEMNVAALLSMTGMRVAWNYSENVISSRSMYENKNFVRTANFLSQYERDKKFWDEIIDVKIKFVLDAMETDKIEIDSENLWKAIRSRIEEKGLEKHHNDKLTPGNAEQIAKFHVFVFTEPRILWKPIIDFIYNALWWGSKRGTLLLTSNIHPKDYFEETVKRILLKALSNQMNFEFLNIDNMSFLKRVETINSGTGEL